MSADPLPPVAPPPPPPRFSLGQTIGGAFRNVLWVFLIGMGVATLFTAWTPGNDLFSPAWFSEVVSTLKINQVAVVSTPTAPPPTAPPRPLPRLGVVAGHNGPQNDPGAVCPDGLTEAGVNRDIATRVKAGLEANGFQVDLLDEFDPRLEGYEALALVSIHNDSCDYINDEATGFKVARATASGVPELADRLTNCLVDRYPKQTGQASHRGSITRDMTEYHTFYEINPSTPAVIIETGFLNLDRKLLTEQPYRPAQGIVDGILCYALNEPLAPTPTP